MKIKMTMPRESFIPVFFTILLLLQRTTSFTAICNQQYRTYIASRTVWHGTPSDESTHAVVADIAAEPELPPVSSTAKRLFLVRHGEVINPGGDRPVYYGAMDVPLSPLGEAEARAAGDYLAQFELEHVISSPLARAIYGAEKVLSKQENNNNSVLQKSLLIKDGFKELDRGSWCGKTKEEIGSDMMARFDNCDESVTPDGGESYLFLKDRVLKARDEVLDVISSGCAAAIVSHLQVTRCMLSDALDIPTNQMADLKIATASVTCIDYDGKDGTQTVHFQSFKPNVGLQQSKDGAN